MPETDPVAAYGCQNLFARTGGPGPDGISCLAACQPVLDAVRVGSHAEALVDLQGLMQVCGALGGIAGGHGYDMVIGPHRIRDESSREVLRGGERIAIKLAH
jgi:hypothetical protein